MFGRLFKDTLQYFPLYRYACILNSITIKCLIDKFVSKIMTITFWILECRIYFIYISHLLHIWTFGTFNNSIIGFYYFISFAYLNFWIFEYFYYWILLFHTVFRIRIILMRIRIRIKIPKHWFQICWIFEILDSCIFPSEFPSQESKWLIVVSPYLVYSLNVSCLAINLNYDFQAKVALWQCQIY